MTTITVPSQNPPAELSALAAELSLPPLLPVDPALAEEVAGFNAAVAHRPAVVVRATRASDVTAAVRFARRAGLRVAVQATGHGALAPVEGGVLVSTRRMDDVHVDPVARRVRIGAGVRWDAVITAAARHGLAPLSGSSSAVGAVGYTLGGGLGPLGRRYGFAADRVHAVEVVTGDGFLRRATAQEDADLFWAIRGGKGGFGVVTAVELDLVPVTTLYGGGLFYAGEHAAAVLRAWARWAPDLPEETSTSVALLRLPDDPHVPPPLRGCLSVHVRVAHSGDTARGVELVAPMRAAAPVLADLVGELPFTEADSIHKDPHDPLPFWEQGSTLRELPGEAVDAVLATAGPDADVPLIMVELRLLGGALGRPAAVPNAVAGRSAAFSVFTLGLAVPDLAQAVPAAGGAVHAALAPWAGGERLLNFAGRAAAEDVWDEATLRRLRQVKAWYDPAGLFGGSPS